MASALDYSYTKAGVLGCHRETMLQNQLLLLPRLGKPMRRGYHFPGGEDFTFGTPNKGHDGGAREAMGCWNTGEERKQKSADDSIILPIRRKEKKAERDFKSLNRAAVQAGLTQPNEQYHFRATHDIRRRQSDEEKNKTRTRRLPPQMVYGIATRPSTPIFDLLENKYQDRWLDERKQSELAKREKDETKKHTVGKVYETRASLLRTYQNPVDPGPLWKMQKFNEKAKPHLQTFRSGRARDQAFEHHKSDCISRKGVFGHGIYESAKS
ncbi:cilia- and flagella-associated protein 77-like [Tubulanus polymorphus]|uniref:cilia- and flagella-associated protein 77-like n=1 Tax=Tubulanus polymorphus TaxID=672921 RepID=UPI003DA5CA3F